MYIRIILNPFKLYAGERIYMALPDHQLHNVRDDANSTTA